MEEEEARTRALFAFCNQSNKQINKQKTWKAANKQTNKVAIQALQDRKQDYEWQIEGEVDMGRKKSNSNDRQVHGKTNEKGWGVVS